MQRGNGQTPSQRSADIIQSVLAAAAASGLNQNPGGTSPQNQLQLIMAQQHQLVNPAVAINTQQPGSQLRSVQGSPRRTGNFQGQGSQQPSFIKVPVSPSGSILDATSPVQGVTTGQAPLLLQHGRLLQLPQTVNMVTSSPQTIQTVQFQNTQGCISVPQLNTTMSIPVALSNQLSTQKRTSGSSPGRSSNSRKSPISATGNPSHASHMPSHPSKMLKMQVQLPDNPRSDDLQELRRCVLLRKERELKELKENYTENLIELFFLQKDGNMMDFVAYRKRPTPQLVSFLQAQALDGSGGVRRSSSDSHKAKSSSSSDKMLPSSSGTKATPAVTTSATPGFTADFRKRTVTQAGLEDITSSKNGEPPKTKVKVEQDSPVPVVLESRIEVTGNVSKATTTTHLPTVQSIQTEIKLKKTQSEPASTSSSSTFRPASVSSTTLSSSTLSSQKVSAQSTTPSPKITKSISGGRYTPGRQNSMGNMVAQEKIVERAKQEAQVMQRIGQLRKEGLWSARRLPKVQEPPRHKTHWDYLLEEMQWLAADFAGERRWKKAASRKLVRSVAKYHQECKAKMLKAERDEASRMRRIASNIAKEVKQFWSNIEKVVQYKQQSRLDERRKKALDLQLDFIVGQTEKYSSWLTEGLNVSTAGSSVGSIPPSPTRSTGGGTGDDGEFQPDADESDDETTIRVEEEEAGENLESEENELKLLEKESQLPIQELLDSLPPEILEKPADLDVIAEDSETTRESKKEDEEFVPTDEEEDNSVVDDEETLEEQEDAEGSQDHKVELDELAADGELSIEELMERYAGAYTQECDAQLDSDDEEESDAESFTEESEESSDEYDELEDIEDEDDAESVDNKDGEAMDIEYLLNPDKENKQPVDEQSSSDSSPNNEITEFAATAQSLQPTGYTLETTLVKTKVPFLLRHTLREYQHIGLDWLVTMHEKKLNGILADEMGLGKTIQTIAVLAHLACEEGIWGPHLIVVPTSVMLNWEMELKKWCPAFKILTYYGSQKERKQKRQGWTKCNAFHVCVTSYKLVIQDHQAFRRKKWKYLVLDEAQNIKNFKSQRWQTLLNFNSQRRLLLTGTPLQNSLMELWSLMHFLMPHVFQSHREFKEWFSNPVTGMIEGNTDYNEGLIKRLHKVLRPFLLRRLKSEVEKQLPKKYEHIVTCRLSNRQRYLYEDFMSRAKTKETLASGQFLSVINVLMQLRKVCNHPDLFELRPIVSSFTMEGIVYRTAALVLKALEYDPFKHIKFESFNLCLADHELNLPAYAAHRIKQLQTPRPLIEEIDSLPDPPSRPNKVKVKPGKLFSHIPNKETGRVSPFSAASTTASNSTVSLSTQAPTTAVQGGRSSPVVSHMLIKTSSGTIIQRAAGSSSQGLVLGVSSQQQTSGSASVTTTASSSMPSTVALVSQQAVPTTTQLQQLPGYTIPSGGVLQQRLILQPQGGGRTQFLTHPITVQLQGQHGTRIALPASQIRQIPQGGIVQIVQTASGQQILRGVQLATTTQIGQSSTNQQLITTSRSGSPQIQLLTQGQLRTTAQSPRMTQLLITTSAGVSSSPSHVIKSSTAAAQLLSAVNTVSSAGKLHLGSNLPASMRPVVRVSPLNSDSLPPTATSLLSKVSLASSQTKAVTTSGLVLKVAPQPVSSTSTSSASLILNHPSLTTKQTVSTTMSRKDLTPMAVVSPATAIKTTPAVTTTSSSITDPKLDVKAITTTSDTITTKAASSSVATIVTSLTAPKTSTTSLSKGKSRTRKEKAVDPEPKKSPLYLESLVKHRKDCHKATLTRIADINRWRCGAKPVYGQDLCRAVSIINCLETPKELKNIFRGVGYFICHNTYNHPSPNHSKVFFKTTKFLQEAIQTPETKIQHLQPIFKRFMMTVSPAWSSGISIHTSPADSSAVLHNNYIQEVLSEELTPRTRCLHALQSATRLQFPELRLIQYDCGKLQTLDVLLRRLKPEGHRVLIFTQMTKMLDVLEKFLNFHGHTYLRLDGATKVESRQILMERFNADKRIFCFILSTRSGGLGINLTGADTVVFYDSDWNPTMDAQAQDRCHRIGQTRDVHIYRLVSEMTVEENILKKANQKRLLADVSIEGGNFTTAFFKKHALTELFEKPEQPESREELQVAQNQKVSKSQPDITKELPKPDELKANVSTKVLESEGVVTSANPNLSQLQLEQALAKAEDERDVQAASMAHAEQDAELAEFDEDIPFDGEERSGQKEETSRVEMELAQLQDQLTPIEKYALIFLESTVEPLSDEQLNEAEEQIEIAKQEWELSHLQALKEEEERKAEMEEDEIFYTYTREDAYNKIYISQTNKIMPMWSPPTPPQDDNDVYVDNAFFVMYEPSVMTETQLPSIYTKKEHKKAKEINAVATVRKPKTHSKGDHMQPPRSLFDRPSSAWHKMRRDAKQQKMRDMVKPMKPLPTVHKPEVDTQQDKPEWLINEDWALLQAIQTLLELPLNLQVLVPGHTINWELVSDVVNSCSRIYRSPKQCKNRYESVIVPREEGKILYDTNPKKQKKSKALYKSMTKNNRPMKTSHLHTQDNNSSHTMLYSNKFDQIKVAVGKRQPYLKQVLNNPLLKNPKHSAVLQDYSINYDKPLLPLQVAAKRADRIAKEKKEKEAQIKQTAAQNAAAAAAASVVKTTAVATAAATTVLQASTVARPVIGTTTLPVRVTAGNSIVVNTQGGVVSVSNQQLASINKRLNQQSVTAANASQIATSIAQIVRTQGGRTQVTLPTSAALHASQLRTTTPASIMVSTVSGVTTIQARATPTASLATAAMVKATASNLSAATISPANFATYKRQAQAQAQPATIKQQFKPVDLKRMQQAQAQAKAAQAEAHAQAQASQQLVTCGSPAAVVASIVQQQRVQKPATLTRPLKEAEISLIKRQLQQHKLSQSATKVAVTTVSGVTVSGVVTVGQQKGQTLKQLTFTPQQLRTLQMQQLLRQKQQQQQQQQQQKIQTLTAAQAAQLTQKAQILATQQQKLQAARLVAQVQQGSATQHIQVTPTITTAQQLQQVQKAVQSGQVQVQQSSGQTTVQQIPRQQLIQLSRTGGPSTTLAIQQTSKPITVISGPSATLNASQLAQVVSATNAQKQQSAGQTATHVVSIAPPILQSGTNLQAQVVRAAGIQEAVAKAAQSVAITVPALSQSQAKMDVIMVEQHGATETVITEPPSPAESNDSKKEESGASDTDPSSSTTTRSYAMRTRTSSKH